MSQISIVNIKGKTFFERLLNSMKWKILIITILTFVMLKNGEVRFAITLNLVLLLLWLFLSINRCRYYITKIVKASNQGIIVRYLDFNQEKDFISNIRALRLNKGLLWARTWKVYFLDFKSEKNSFKIKQYSIGEWNETIMDNVLKNWTT